jgi:TRAP-type C4-dicarboxylate transport system substrate-binding protein
MRRSILQLSLAAGALSLAALSLAALTSSQVTAQQTIRLTIVSGNPPTFTAVGAAIEALMPKIDEILAKSGKFKINWVQGWSGSIVKPRGELEGIQTGVGDVAVMPGPFFPDKLTLYQIGYYTPFTSKDLDVVTEGMNFLLTKFPEMGAQAEKFNQVTLKISGVSDNYLIFTKREISRFADIKGMKIAAVGANQPWVAAAGATPVATELATQYNAYQTGVFDGILNWQQAYTAFRMCELGRYRLNVDFGAISPILITVNKDVWTKLPDEVKTAFRQAADVWAKDNDRRIKQGSEAGRQRCEKEHNLKVTELSAEDRRAWAFALPPIAKEWAKRQDAAGLPGTKMLAAWMDFMREKKQPIVRHWDRE